ncbi:myo-inosose-2 dehydratase [soil metagenome]
MNGGVKNRVGIGPIGWVNDDIRGWGPGYSGERVMREMAELGYEGSEMSYSYPQDPLELKRKLSGHGLTLAGAYRWTNLSHADLLDEEMAKTRAHIDFCQAAGSSYANVAEGGGSLHWDARGPKEGVEALSNEAWERLAAALDELGRYALRQGVRLSVHPHGGTAIETPAQIDRIFTLTDPELVGYCLDSGHIFCGGGDPAAVTQNWVSRVSYVHLKDVRGEVLARVRAEGLSFLEAVKANVFCTPGAGVIDFDPMIEALRGVDYGGWFVVEAEQDPALHDPYRVSGEARAFLRDRYGL